LFPKSLELPLSKQVLFSQNDHIAHTLRPQTVKDDVATTTALEILNSFIISLVLVFETKHMLDLLIFS
jgi:hypothetical protein